MIKKLILILFILVILDFIIKNNFDNQVLKKETKYEYNGKYKDPHKERIVEHIGK